MAGRYWEKEAVPFTAMVVAEIVNVIVNVLFKAASSKGMSYSVFIVYSYVVASLAIFPFLFIFPSKTPVPSNKLPLIWRILILGPIGVSSQIAGFKGIQYSSPTLSSAISNLMPAFTFTLAVIFRIEKVFLRSSITQAKIIGTLVSIGGALVVVLYKGPTVLSVSSSAPSLMLNLVQSDWVIGGGLIAAQILIFSLWYIVQTQIMKIYPAELNVVFIYNSYAAILSALACSVIGDADSSSWSLGSGVALAAVVCSGIFVPCFNTLVHTWGLNLKGPVYVTCFKPLSIVIAAIMGFVFLGDALHLGSVIGSIILCSGFYAVLWGKAKEARNDDSGYSSLGIPTNIKSSLLEDHP